MITAGDLTPMLQLHPEYILRVVHQARLVMLLAGASHRLLGAGVVGIRLIIQLQLVVDFYWLLLAVIRKVQLHEQGFALLHVRKQACLDNCWYCKLKRLAKIRKVQLHGQSFSLLEQEIGSTG